MNLQTNEQSLADGKRIVADLERYFIHVPAPCPYGLSRKAVYRQGQFGRLPDDIFGHFLRAGYRRNGNCLYTMECRGCRACVPIRLAPEKLIHNRSQRRALQRNQGVRTEIGRLSIDPEPLALCSTFLQSRFPGPDNSALEYYTGFFCNSLCNTYEIRYRIGEQLMGVAIVDLSPQWLNAVYFYFDPEFAKRSPGVFNVLFLADFCRTHSIGHLYLGYWISEVKAMRYKTGFRPHQLLVDGEWREQATG